MAILQQDHQSAFDQFTINALNIIHDDKTSKSIISQLKASEDTVEAVGEIAVTITNRIESGLESKNINVTGNTIINSMNVIVGELIGLAEAAGATPLAPEQKYQAFSWSLSRYLEDAVKSGKITPEELQQMKTTLEEEEIKEYQKKQGDQGGDQPMGGEQAVNGKQQQPPPGQNHKGLLAGGI